MVGTTSNWEDELRGWLKPFLDRLGHKSRRRMCPLYVAGLIGPGDRKSVQPMAERLAPGDYDQLHHFVAAGVWDAAPLETELLIRADRLVGGSDAVLVIDDTAVPKKGTHSVGVAAQYASALGKTANCQTLVSLTLARGEVPVMVALRLFLPDSWVNDRRRLKRAGVPAEYRTSRTKPEIALAEIDRLISIGVRFRCVLADAGYGLSAPFRQGLTARKLAWAVGIPRHLKVYPVGDEAWLIGEHRASGEKKYYLANLAAGMDLRSLAATIKARWICEQAHQQLKEELGLDHFEGRSWHGLHRHALMAMIAYAFLQHRRLKKVRRGKKNQRPAPSTDVAGGSPRHRRPHHAIKSSAMSVLPILDQRGKAA